MTDDMNDLTPPEGRVLLALGLGSNDAPPLGADAAFRATATQDPRAHALETCLDLLWGAGWRIVATSSLHETKPVGVGEEHGPYLNAAALVHAPDDLAGCLETCQEIERRAGRAGKGDLSPRSLDVDLIAAWRAVDGGLAPCAPLALPGLTLPHPRVHERVFVLEPLAEIGADLAIVTERGRQSVRELLVALRADE